MNLSESQKKTVRMLCQMSNEIPALWRIEFDSSGDCLSVKLGPVVLSASMQIPTIVGPAGAYWTIESVLLDKLREAVEDLAKEIKAIAKNYTDLGE